jgi:hypothetical protein
MSLGARVAQLEASARERVAEPCRWHRGIVLFPEHFPLGVPLQQARAMCEAPRRCAASDADRLLVVVDEDEEVSSCT